LITGVVVAFGLEESLVEVGLDLEKHCGMLLQLTENFTSSSFEYFFKLDSGVALDRELNQF
jgi:hypothetical protein